MIREKCGHDLALTAISNAQNSEMRKKLQNNFRLNDKKLYAFLSNMFEATFLPISWL